jgi:hypothetical protein
LGMSPGLASRAMNWRPCGICFGAGGGGRGERRALVCLDHYGVDTAGIGALSGLEIGLLFHAVISVIRGEGNARGKRRLGKQ